MAPGWVLAAADSVREVTAQRSCAGCGELGKLCAHCRDLPSAAKEGKRCLLRVKFSNFCFYLMIQL